MIRRLPVLCCAVAALLAGCTLAPEYTRPEAPVPATWPRGAAYEGAAAPEAPLGADLGWRQFFTDPQVQRLIETALENNRDLRLAALNVERARALYRIQRAELLPSLDVSASGSRRRLPDIFGFGRALTLEQYSVDVGIASWELDFFGRLRSLKRRALEEYLATEEARRSAQILLISEVANAYLALAADRENLKLAESTLENEQSAYNLVRRRHEVGLAPELDLRQAQTRVEVARGDVARFSALVAQDENALNLLVGAAPVEPDLLPAALSSVTPPPDISAGTSSEVLLRRPDVVRAENLLKAANANIGAARAAFFPRISLSALVGTASDALTGLFGAGTGSWSYGADIAGPIFDPRTVPALAATKVERQIAVAQYEKAIQEAFRDVADALAEKGTLGERLEAQRSLVEAAAETYRLAKARYEKGIDTYLPVLDAQRSLYSAQQGLIFLRLATLANQVRLYAALGGGAAPEGPPEEAK